MTDDVHVTDPPEDDLERRTDAIYWAALEVVATLPQDRRIGDETNGEKRTAVAGFEEYLRKRGYRVGVISLTETSWTFYAPRQWSTRTVLASRIRLGQHDGLDERTRAIYQALYPLKQWGISPDTQRQEVETFERDLRERGYRVVPL